ncbi:MAG: zinc ABC transporter substrate-binding protein [Alphaproteobacteria bacterium]|nr:zinc ABC transporter substrate-binding protein [Alphaproteobacteria bacterium]
MRGPLLIQRGMRAALLAVPLSWWAHASLASAEDGGAVVASIKPVHSLVSAVMAGVGEPQLLIRGSSSPHTFSLRPSDAAVLEDASVIFWIGDSMESSLAGPISTLGREARLVTLSEAADLVRRPLREGGGFEGHAHHDGDQGGRDHGRHDEDHDEDHDNETVGRDGVAFDMHIWLDPHNAGVMARTIADMLSEVDPANADRYASNAETLAGRLEVLRADIDALVAPARGQPFIMFHDAYRYFEDRFGLAAVGSVVVSLERTPGVRRILDLRDKVRELGVVCVFSEPQFQPRLVTTIIEDTPARAGVVDPLGASIETGPELYFTLLRDMAESFAECLTPDQDGSGQ